MADESGGVKRSESEAIVVARDVNRRRVADARGEDVLRAIAGEAMRIDPDLADVELIEDCGDAAAVIGVRVREDDGVEAANAAIDEKREEYRLAFAGSGVDEDGVVVRARDDRVALADVEGDELRGCGGCAVGGE